MIPLWENGKFCVPEPDTDPNWDGSHGSARCTWRYVTTLAAFYACHQGSKASWPFMLCSIYYDAIRWFFSVIQRRISSFVWRRDYAAPNGDCESSGKWDFLLTSLSFLFSHSIRQWSTWINFKVDQKQSIRDFSTLRIPCLIHTAPASPLRRLLRSIATTRRPACS